MSKLSISRAGLNLIESFEGFRAIAAPLKDGNFSIGFGHTNNIQEGMEITHEEAEELLKLDLAKVEEEISELIHAPLSQNQFDALVSFAFNIGIENFKTSQTLAHLNQGEPVAAAIAMGAWRRANVNGKSIVVDALVRRRACETTLFLETRGPRPAAPTGVIIPRLDYEAALNSPRPNSIKDVKVTNEDLEKIELESSEPEIIQISAEIEESPANEVDEIMPLVAKAIEEMANEIAAKDGSTRPPQEDLNEDNSQAPQTKSLNEATETEEIKEEIEIISVLEQYRPPPSIVDFQLHDEILEEETPKKKWRDNHVLVYGLTFLGAMVALFGFYELAVLNKLIAPNAFVEKNVLAFFGLFGLAGDVVHMNMSIILAISAGVATFLLAGLSWLFDKNEKQLLNSQN